MASPITRKLRTPVRRRPRRRRRPKQLGPLQLRSTCQSDRRGRRRSDCLRHEYLAGAGGPGCRHAGLWSGNALGAQWWRRQRPERGGIRWVGHQGQRWRDFRALHRGFSGEHSVSSNVCGRSTPCAAGRKSARYLRPGVACDSADLGACLAGEQPPARADLCVRSCHRSRAGLAVADGGGNRGRAGCALAPL